MLRPSPLQPYRRASPCLPPFTALRNAHPQYAVSTSRHQPDADDLAGPEPIPPSPNGSPEAYRARECAGQDQQSLGRPITVVIVKVLACVRRVPFARSEEHTSELQSQS